MTYPSNKTHWIKIIELIKFYKFHVFYSIKEGWANVTERDGTLHKITERDSFEKVENFLKGLIKSKAA